jgi:hypothetical protein
MEDAPGTGRSGKGSRGGALPGPPGGEPGAAADHPVGHGVGAIPCPRSRSVGALGAAGNAPVGRAAARGSRTDLVIEEAIARLVAEAPPLSPATRTRLAELFSVTQRRADRRPGRQDTSPSRPPGATKPRAAAAADPG